MMPTHVNGMAQRRKIEVFTAGCPCCIEAVHLVEFLAGTEHDVEIRDYARSRRRGGGR